MYLLQAAPQGNTAGFVVLLGIGLAIYFYFQQKNNKHKALKAEYDDALKGVDKKRALAAGRAYYSSLRKNNTLTIYDEQAISNDLQSMDHARVNK